MAYADRNSGGSRVVALIVVALIHAVLGLAFIRGLAYNYYKKQAEDLKTFDIEEPPPPPEEVPPPPPPPDTPVPPPPTQIVQPPQVIQNLNVNPIDTTFKEQPKPEPKALPTPAPTPTPTPTAPRVAKQLKPRTPPQSWVTNDDYPAAAIRQGASGTTGFRLDVDASGKVTNCSITSSSGSSLLDSTVCSLLKRRARFTPAEDAAGNKIPAPFQSRFRWELPSDR